MKFNLELKKLLKGTDNVSNAITGSSTLPILEGILVKADKNKLILTGSDVQTTITCTLDAQIDEDGSIIVDKDFFVKLKKFDNENIEFKKIDNENNTSIVCGKTKVELAVMGKEEDFALPESIEDGKSFTISGKDFKKLIKSTSYAAAEDETRPILMGVLFKCANKKLDVVALDGYRLALNAISIDCEEEFELVIPNKTITTVSKLATDSDIKISFTEKRVVFTFDNIVLSSTLLEGKFINYKSLIPQESNMKLTVDSKTFKSSIDKCSSFETEKALMFKITKDTIKVRTLKSDLGQVEDELPCVSDGELELAFNPKYLMDCLNVVEGEVEMYFQGAQSPCLVRTPKNKELLGLVLPVRLMGK